MDPPANRRFANYSKLLGEPTWEFCYNIGFTYFTGRHDFVPPARAALSYILFLLRSVKRSFHIMGSNTIFTVHTRLHLLVLFKFNKFKVNPIIIHNIVSSTTQELIICILSYPPPKKKVLIAVKSKQLFKKNM